MPKFLGNDQGAMVGVDVKESCKSFKNVCFYDATKTSSEPLKRKTILRRLWGFRLCPKK